ncbi:MAG: hypothetical protein HQL37_15500 [Alphaproteobacteria bacterium]|nr:hypothetical protein [Alphaproteobacteria bacterium]
MTEAQQNRILESIAIYTKEITASPEAARAALIREGIYLENGGLSPNYRDSDNYVELKAGR